MQWKIWELHAHLPQTCIMHRAKKNPTVKMCEGETGINLKLYCTTLYHRSNGLTSQLLANGIMESRDKKKTRTMMSEDQDKTMSNCHDRTATFHHFNCDYRVPHWFLILLQETKVATVFK